MSAYAPASSLGWLDFDAAASERVSTLLRALDEPGTVDSLGLGTVRDTFANLLSPGTSTVQTRLRYFIFLPWIFLRLERERVSPADFDRRLRDHESRLIDSLHHLGAFQGVIGYFSRRELQRMPSVIYWWSMGSWGIRRLDLSLDDYGRRAASFGRLRPDRDDDGNVTMRIEAMWAALPDPPADFLGSEITFDLTRDEAAVLVEHIRQRHPDSLLAAMCNDPSSAADADLPWDVPSRLVTDRLAEVMRHARCFSEVTVGPQHAYNLLLAGRARAELKWQTDELEAQQREHLRRWAAQIDSRHRELHDWASDLPAFWQLIATHGTVSGPTRTFVDQIVRHALADPATFADNPLVRSSIRDRELRLKSNRARLSHRSPLETWNLTPFGGQLDYRWGVTQGYLRDIAAALPRGA